MRRIAGSLCAEDGLFSGFGGFVLVRNGEDGFGGLGEQSRGVSIGLGWENFVMEWGVKR